MSIVYKPFRKEACNFCFHYDNGRKMKIAFIAGEGKTARGLAWFCSEECKEHWVANMGKVGIDALRSISAALLKSQKAGSVGDDVHKQITPSCIVEAWRKASESPPQGVRLIHEEDDEDTLAYLLNGMIAHFNSKAAWHDFLSLAPSLQPYLNHSPNLASHIRLYDFLRLHLPKPMLSSCEPEIVVDLVTRDRGNSFGIFELDLPDGEMLGYGTWVAASFFNHSCRPNLSKKTSGRALHFYTLREAKEGDELCISYIGDAKSMSLRERRKRLQAGWSFICQCEWCSEEEGRMETNQAE